MPSRDKATRRRRPATAEKEAADKAEEVEASDSPQETSPSDLTSSSDGGASSSSSSSPSMPPLSSSSKSEVIASVMSSSRGAPSALPVSMTAEGTAGVVGDTGARRRSNAAAAAAAAAARVSLKDYLERNKPADHMEEAEQQEAEKNERERKRERRRRRRSRSRGRSRGGSRSRKSKKSSRSAASDDDDDDDYDEEDGRTYGGANSVFTNSTGLISVREVRKAWGAMFFAAVMGSFVGTGGLHRLLNRHAYSEMHPRAMPEAQMISRVPPPPSSYSKSHGLRGSMGTNSKPVRPFDLDAEGYEDDIFAAESREQIEKAKAAKSSRAETVDKKPSLKPRPSSKLAGGGIGDVGLMGGVDEEALRDMEILMGKKVGGGGAASSAAAEAGTVDLTPSLGDDAGKQKKTKNKKKSAVVATQEIPVPVYGGAAIVDDKDPDDENNKDEAEEEESDEESDKEEGEEGAMYAPVSGKRPHRNGDGTIPEALKP